MSKELPYFKFIASEFLLGRIYTERDGIKGAFISACAYYWFKKCTITRVELDKKLGRTRVQLLLNKEYLLEFNEFILIPFLDEQKEELTDNHNFNKENGKKGADKKRSKIGSGASGGLKHLDKDKDKDKDKIRITWADPIFFELLKKWFSYKKDRKESYKSEESEKAFEKKLKKLSGNDIEIAEEIIENSIASNYAGIFPLKRDPVKNGVSDAKTTDKVATTLSQHEAAKNILHGKSN